MGFRIAGATVQEYHQAAKQLDHCDVVHSQVIADITRRMGDGMAEFIEKEVLTVRDYDLYCHYVAGLVGIGLCQVLTP